jgi:NodT family efflux transporter outer membrane factor (OMF) lipoprotein
MIGRPAAALASLAIAGLLAALAGCAAVGPGFTPPAAPSAGRYLSDADKAEATASAVEFGSGSFRQRIDLGTRVTAQWWTLFRSPPLDTLVKQAVAGSPPLESARARLAQAQAAVEQARGALYPDLGVGVAEAEEKQSPAAFGLPPNAFPLPPRFNLLRVGPTASYNLDLFGGVRRAVEQQSALADVQRDQLDAAYMTLTGATVAQALRIAALRGELSAIEEILASDRENAALVGKERQVGEAPDPDVVVARSQIAADEALKPTIEQQLSLARHALALLVGRPPGDFTAPDFDLAGLVLPAQPPVSLPSELVHQRPDILAAEARLHAASAAIGVATARLYPSVTLSAGATASSLNGSNLFNPEGLAWSIAAGLTEPVFDGGVRRAQRRAAVAAFRASAADYQQTVLQAFRQVADLLQALDHDADQIVAQQRALELASQSVRLRRIAYGRGAIGLLPVLDAERQYQQARLGWIRSVAQRYEDTAQLLVAMGGGWWGGGLATRAEDPGGQGRK